MAVKLLYTAATASASFCPAAPGAFPPTSVPNVVSAAAASAGGG